MSTKKTPLGGRPISRKEAYKGLGDPKKWKQESDAVYAEFRAKPGRAQPAQTLLTKVVGKIKAALVPKPKSHQEPVYARRGKRRPVAKRKPRKLPSPKR